MFFKKIRICSNSECQTIYDLSTNPPKQENICNKFGKELGKGDVDDGKLTRENFKVYEKKIAPLIKFYTANGARVEVLNISKLNSTRIFRAFVTFLKDL